MVVQPAVIFGKSFEQTKNNSVNNHTSLLDSDNVDPVDVDRQSWQYMIGVCLCVYTAGALSLTNIIQVPVTNGVDVDLNSNHLLLMTGTLRTESKEINFLLNFLGFCGVLLSMVTSAFIPNPLLSSPSTVSLFSLAMLLVSGTITLLAAWSKVLAVSLTQLPTLVTMMRSTEICISMVTESVYWGHLPNTLSSIGSLLVRMTPSSYQIFICIKCRLCYVFV